MNAPQRVVLIGDPDGERFEWFKELLADVYAIGAVRAQTFEEVKKFARDRLQNLIAQVVFLTDDLPYSDNPSKNKRDAHINFLKLEEIEQLYTADFVCIVTREPEPDFEKFDKRPHHLHLRSFPPTPEDRQKIIIELGSLGSRLRPAIEISAIDEIAQWDVASRTLRRQIRSLSEWHDLADGKKHLLRLIRNCLDCDSAEKIEIKRLGQGNSGASVFRLVMSTSSQTKEYVLKLSDALWKLESEVNGHLAAREIGLPEYEKHVAMLRRPISPIKPTETEGQFIVNSGQWYAIHYDFLGGPAFGKFIDLETALTVAPSTLLEKTKDTGFALASTNLDDVLAHRLKIFSVTLDGLCDMWYGKKELCSRRSKEIWRIDDAPDRKFLPLPPYQLTRRVKGWVQDFLDSRESAIGARLLPDWNSHREHVLKLVGDESVPSALGRLGESIPFTLSPVHGDLNTNNVLLWLKYDKYPFVIDLPFFQRDGHALQDFARLEVEIKFALLDRQEESPKEQLTVYDYTSSQVTLWIEMEDRLLESRALDESKLRYSRSDGRDWKADGFKDNVTLCYKLIMLIREKACEVQQKALEGAPSAAPFAAEYLPALLYHTIRSIGYPSLSVFKRLLAVRSSGLILERLERVLI